MRSALSTAAKSLASVQRARFHSSFTSSQPEFQQFQQNMTNFPIVPQLHSKTATTLPLQQYQFLNTTQLLRPNLNLYSHLCKPTPAQQQFYAQQPALVTQPKLDLNLGILAEQDEGIQFTSVLRKRRTMMNRHKLKKRRKRERFITRKSTKE